LIIPIRRFQEWFHANASTDAHGIPHLLNPRSNARTSSVRWVTASLMTTMQAADLFRNKVSNQKDYILAPRFFKRVSDL
jgi:hypothetical protein